MSTRVRALLPALAVLAAMTHSGWATPPPAEPVSIRLIPASPASIELGRAFEFDVAIRNTLPVPVVGAVTIDFLAPQPHAPIALEPWAGSIAGGGSVRLSRYVVSGRWLEATGRFAARAFGEFSLLSARELGVIAAPAADTPVTITASPVALPRFQDVTQQVGISTRLRTGGLCQVYGAGAAWGDVDGDERIDLFVPQRTGPSELWINQPGGFVERATDYGVTNRSADGTYRRATGSNFIDYDADGRLDLFVLNDGINRLYKNTGSGFIDVTVAAGLDDDANHTSAAWGDYDGDGNLDVFVTTHGRRATCQDAFSLLLDRLYRGNGEGGFTDESELLRPAGTPTGLSFQGSWVDYNNDGRLDLYVSNDRTGGNILWRNDGPGPGGRWQFTNVSASSGAGLLINAMGTAVGDFNRDGFFDLGISDLGPLKLLKNGGNGKFAEVGSDVGLLRGDEHQGWAHATWGLDFEDLNADGWEDLYVAAGELETNGNPTRDEPDQIFVNDGAGRFLDLSGPSGADDPAVGRSAAWADFDGDGRPDFFLMNQDGTPRLFRNVTPGFGNWLHVRVLDAGGRAACGARLSLPGSSPPVTRQVSCGSTGLGNGSDPVIRLGLGTQAVVSLRLDWPTGESLTVPGVSAGRVVTIARP